VCRRARASLARAVKTALGEHPDCRAVFLTSPDYFGALCDIWAIAKICREKNAALLVDNAHGAHLGLFSGLHPMALGADACCDSLHKTLPALTGAALLHLRDEKKAPLARRRMPLFGSTSPSYLIQLSADYACPTPYRPSRGRGGARPKCRGAQGNRAE
jgi:arginine/lysine/ornithine decarboxylase